MVNISLWGDVKLFSVRRPSSMFISKVCPKYFTMFHLGDYFITFWWIGGSWWGKSWGLWFYCLLSISPHNSRTGLCSHRRPVCHRYGSFSAMYSHRRAMAVFIVHPSLIQHCAEVYAIAWTEWGALSLICTHFSLVGMWGRILDHTNLKLHWVSQLHGWAGPDLFYDVYRIQESLADKPTWWGISESRKSDYSKIISGTLHLVVL